MLVWKQFFLMQKDNSFKEVNCGLPLTIELRVIIPVISSYSWPITVELYVWCNVELPTKLVDFTRN